MENQEQTNAPTQPELSLNDLQNLRALIDVAVRRGAFSAAESSSVGAVFDRLNTFLNAVMPQPSETKTDEPAAETPAE